MKADPAFFLELGVLLLLLGVAGAFAWRIGLSAVPLFLLAGLLVGEGGFLPAPTAGPVVEECMPSGRKDSPWTGLHTSPGQTKSERSRYETEPGFSTAMVLAIEFCCRKREFCSSICARKLIVLSCGAVETSTTAAPDVPRISIASVYFCFKSA